jgi:large repetitive protein
MTAPRRRIALVAAALAAQILTWSYGTPVSAAAELVLSKSAPGSALAGETVRFALTASNPGDAPEYNLTFRDVLAPGVTYVPGSTEPASAQEPDVVENLVEFPVGSGESITQQTLLWRNVADLQAGDEFTIEFRAVLNETPSLAEPTLPVFVVGSTVENQGEAFASPDPRRLPRFTSAGVPIADAAIDTATSDTTTTTLSAIDITKSEPSPEGELLRGVHDNVTEYTLQIRITDQDAVNGLVVTDHLPAALEFLGCNDVDNSTAPEYPGAPALGAGPTVPGCVLPDTVETVVDPPADGSTTYPAGTYTKLSWELGDQPAGSTVTLRYAAAIPLRANAPFDDPAPAPDSLLQTANLDNNTGPSTRELAAEASITNIARATGVYQGAVEPGIPVAVESDTEVTRSVEDVRMRKSVSPGVFSAGGRAQYTLTIDTSEYTSAADIVLTDRIPNGICPLLPGFNFAEPSASPPVECEGAADDEPTVAVDGGPPTPITFTATEDTTTGGFDVEFGPMPNLVPGSVAVVTYYGAMRSSYAFGTPDGFRPVSGDGFTNTVELAATTSPIAGTGESGEATVGDSSSATQTSTALSLDKTILPRALLDPGDPCPTTGYVDPDDIGVDPDDLQFRLGDRVCFRLRVDFSSTIYTRNAVVTDFLPVGVDYIAGSALATPDNVLAPSTFNEGAAAAGTEQPTWLVGDPDGLGNTFVEPGGVFEVVLAGRVVDLPDGDAPEILGNLMKLRTENTVGQAQSYRDGLPFAIVPAPPVDITKGVAEVDNPAFPAPPALPPAAPDQDDVTVVEDSLVTYRIDLTNDGSTASSNDYSIRGLEVWDALPFGVDCDDVSNITNLIDDPFGGPVLGVCTNPPDAGHPSFAEAATRSAIRWTFPVDAGGPGGVDRWAIFAGQTRTLTYQVRIPTPTSFGLELVNDASVRSYQAFSNELDVGATYFPADNVDTTVSSDAWNAPAATDPSSVVTPGATVDKTGTTSIGEGGNNIPDQAVAGELLTFTYSVDIPSDTSVFEGVLSDTLPTQFELLGTPAPVWRFYPNAASATTDTQPAGFTLSGDGTLTFPPTYTNSTATTQRFEVEITARVRNNFTQQTGYTNTARFQSLDRVGGTPFTPLTDTYTVNVRQLAPALTKTADVDVVSGDDVVSYTLRATNPNNRPTVHDVWLTDCIPAGLTFAEFAAGSGTTLGPFPGGSTQVDGAGNPFTNTCAAGTTFIAFDLDELPPNANVTRVYRASVDLTAVGGDVYTNSARLTGSTLDDDATNPYVTPNPTERTIARTDDVDVRVPGAGESKTASPDRATIGETVTYTFRATIPANTNFYQSAALDILPPGLDPTSFSFLDSSCVRLASPSEPCGLTATPMPNTVTDGDGNLLVGFLIGDVTGDEFERVLTVRYTARVADVPANAAGTVITNEALTAWDTVDNGNVPNTPAYPWQNRDEESQTADVTVLEPDVAVTKSVSDTTPEPGQNFTYTLRIDNSSAATTSSAHDLVVEDVVPVGVRVSAPSITPPPATFTQPTSTTPGLIRWELPGPVAPGGSIDLTYVAQLAPSAEIDGTAQVNTAEVEGYASLPSGSVGRREYTGNTDVASVTPQFPALTVDKTNAGPVPTYLDETFTWSIAVTNDGGARAFGVAVVDELPTNWAYRPGTTSIALPGGSTITPDPTIDEIAAAPAFRQQLEWAALGQLAPGETLTITFEVEPTADLLTDPGIGSTVPHTNDATASAADGSGATGNLDGPYTGADDATTRIDAVDLVIDKFHPIPPVAGANFDWRVRVTNSSTTDTAVGPFVVTDTLPATPGVSYVTAFGTGWSCSQSSGTVTCTRGGSLAPGASLPVITIRVVTDADLAEGTVITNTAEVDGRTYELDPSDNVDADAATVTTRADLAVTKSLASNLVAGENATYSIGVTNLGPSVSRADGSDPITVTDTLPGAVSFVSASGTGWSCTHDATFPGGTVTCERAGDLAPGPAPSISIVVSVPASASGELRNTAEVSPGTTDDPNPDNDTDVDETQIDAEADLVLTKTALGPFVAGETTTYRLRVDNDGPSDAEATVRITDTLPTGLTYTSASSVTGSWTCVATASGFTCDLASGLALGDAAVVDVTVGVASDVLGDVTNTATVTSPTTDPVPGNNDDDATITVVGVADLVVAKTSSGTATPGGPVEWSVTVANDGPSDSQGPITITDTLPPGLIGPVTASGTGWTCDVVGLSVSCVRGAALPAGDDADVTITAVVDPATPGPDTFTNTATVTPGSTTDPDGSNNSDTDVVALVEPDATLTKAVSDATPQPGEVFTYTVTLTGDADSGTPAYLLTVDDVVPVGVDVDTGTISAGGTYDSPSRTISWTIAGPLAPGASVDLTYDATLSDSATIDRTPLTNTAELTSYSSRPSGGRSYAGNADTATVTPRFPALGAAKTALGPTPTYIGDEFAWEITIANTGDGTADDVDVIDTLPDNWTYVADSTVVTTPSAVVTPNPTITGQELRWESVGALEPGQSLTVTFRAVPTIDVVDAPGVGSAIEHVNRASGAATDPSGGTGNADGAYVSPTAIAAARIDAADLLVTKSSSGTAIAGDEHTWTIGVANASGVDTAVGPFTVTDTLPVGVAFVSAAGTGWSCSAVAATVTCSRTAPTDTLAAGAAFDPIEVTVLVDADTLGEVVNTASVTAETYELDPDTNTDDAPVAVSGLADLAIDKSRSGSLVAGEPVTYLVVVTNLGPSVSRGPITVTDELPDSTTFVTASGADWTCTHDGAPVGGEIECEYAADLAVGVPAPALTITADVATDVLGEVVNTASITGTTTTDPNPDNDTDDDRGTPGTSADLRLEKLATGALVAGAEATYRLRVDNDGPSDAAAPVRITDASRPD